MNSILDENNCLLLFLSFRLASNQIVKDLPMRTKPCDHCTAMAASKAVQATLRKNFPKHPPRICYCSKLWKALAFRVCHKWVRLDLYHFRALPAGRSNLCLNLRLFSEGAFRLLHPYHTFLTRRRSLTFYFRPFVSLLDSTKFCKIFFIFLALLSRCRTRAHPVAMK